MPFNAGGQVYVGGSYLAQGLGALGQGLAAGIEKAQQAEQDEAADNLIMSHALQTGQITPDQYAQFKGMSRTQKNGIVAGLARTFAMDMQQKQMQALEEQRLAQAQLRQQQAAGLQWTPDEAAKQAARWTGSELIQVGPGKWTVVPYGDAGTATGPPVVQRLKTPEGKPIGFVAVTQPGSKQLQILPEPGARMLEQDEQTGLIGFRDRSGFHPLPESLQTLVQSQRARADKQKQQQQQQQQQTGGIRGILQRAYQSIMGGASPTATPIPLPEVPESDVPTSDETFPDDQGPESAVPDTAPDSTAPAPPAPAAAVPATATPAPSVPATAPATGAAMPMASPTEDSYRARAVQLLRANGRPVTDANVRYIMDMLRASDMGKTQAAAAQ